MHKNVRWIAETALMLALLICLQVLTKSFGQIVTGSCVNAVLAVCVLLCGVPSGITVALISPVAAFLLGIAPQVLTVPAIMVGNTAYVVFLGLLSGKPGATLGWRLGGLFAAAGVKFLLLYGAVSGLICGVLADSLMAAGVLKAPMLQALPASFGAMQFVTALLGGSLALLIVPVLKKALRR